MTLKEMQAGAARRLGQMTELRADAARDAEMLVMLGLGVSRSTLFAHPERVLTESEMERVNGLIARRVGMEPMQYIAGVQEFHGLPFRVTRDTLIPRPETEVLVEAVLARVSGVVRIVDVGTGSGAIAVALAHALPGVSVLAVDLSERALEVARENGAANGVAVTFVQGDLLQGVEAGVDVVVSNPPYVPEGDREEMHPQVREFEPAGALFAGSDGLDIYRRLIPQAWGVLAPGGLLAMEIGFGQAEPMGELMRGWHGVEFVEDLRGVKRVVLGRR